MQGSELDGCALSGREAGCLYVMSVLASLSVSVVSGVNQMLSV